MYKHVRAYRAFCVAAAAALLSSLLVGCGGGGGGGGNGAVPLGRTYQSVSASRVVSATTDSAGRLTLYAWDSQLLPATAGAQGSLSSNGQFLAQSPDGSIQFTGTVAADGGSVTGVVRSTAGAGQSLFTFACAQVAPARSLPAALVGSYYGTNSASPLLLTVDAGGYGTLWASVSGATGGGTVTVSDAGAFQTSDGTTAGQLSQNQGVYKVHFTRLGGTALNADVAVAHTGRARWTFMVFLNGANNLQEFGPLNVNQMEQVGSTPQVNMVVQWKQARCYDCGNPDWTGTRRYLITKDNDNGAVHSQMLQDLGQSIDMGDWHELRNFVLWAQQSYPAERYCLVIWNHGAGWRPTRGGTDRRMTSFPRSVSIDDSTNNEIQTWQLPQALSVTPPMDMVVFDASLMQMAEVAYEIRSSAGIVVGSEESPPGEGYVYNTFLADLVANPSETAAQFAADIVNRTLDSYGSGSNSTQSAIDLTRMQTVADRLNTFANTLLQHTGDSQAAMVNARTNAQSYAYPDNKDLWDYADLIKSGTQAGDLKNAATGVQQAITSALIAERHGSGNAGSHGLAIWVPAPSSYLTSYGNLALSRVTNWPKWLQGQP